MTEVKEESAWLIEIPPSAGAGPRWWDGRGPTSFTLDPNDVLRLSRRQDAERALAYLVHVNGCEIRITDHMWLSPAPSGASKEL